MRPKWMTRIFSSATTPQKAEDKNIMDQGDYHSGPEGYSPNTAYSETQYGSSFDEDADWNESEN